jgi:uncharacterized membrane protein
VEKGRLEAFSDGLIAIIITIMVFDMKAPHGYEMSDLLPMAPLFSCYLLTYTFLGIYWSNHHHLLQAITKVNGAVLWANLHLLFWLSLTPFATAWMGQSNFAPTPVAVYGLVLLFAAIAFTVLVRVLIRLEGKESPLAAAVGKDCKGKLSLLLYLVAVSSAYFCPIVSCCIYVAVAIIWLAPDKRIERVLGI